MNPLVESLGPVFIAGFALQQLLNLSEPLLERMFRTQKSWATNLLAFVLSLVITLILHLQALRPFGLAQAG